MNLPRSSQINIESLNISPVASHLYIPPIVWRGDPIGHIGLYDTFFFVKDGEVCLFIESESYILRAGDLAFLPKDKMRAYTPISSKATVYEINFVAQINALPWYSATMLADEKYAVHPKNTEEIAAIFESTVRYELNKLVHYDLAFCAAIASLIAIYAQLRQDEQKRIHAFSDTEKFMKENVEKSLTLGDIAAVSFTEPTYFIRKFKQAYGISPIAYFNKLKICRAMFLLCNTPLSVFDIAKKIGIHDGSYFTRLFKSQTGLTPSEYKSAFLK